MSGPGSHSHDDIKTAMLGRFNTIEVPLILQLLESEGIFAMTKLDSDQPSTGGGYGFPTGAGEVLVEAACLDTARRLVEERLPEIQAAMQAGLESEFGPSE